MKKRTPRSRAIAPYLSGADYADTFVFEVPAGKRVSPEALLIAVFTDMPGWVDALMMLRNRLVRLVGLKGEREGDFAEVVRRGEPHGGASFPVKTDEEIIMQVHDDHLDFRLSLAVFPANRKAGQTLEATTVVHYNNALGRFYFLFVRPFHRVIVPAMLKRYLRKI